MNKFTIRIRNPLTSISIYLYFISVLILSEIDNSYTTIFFYFSALMCMFSLFRLGSRFSTKVHCMILVSVLCGICNVHIIGNLNYIRLFILFLSFYVGLLFLHEAIESKTFLRIYVIYAIFVILMILVKGLGNPIFSYVSNNYASVYLMCPLLVYYIKSERENRKIELYPAILFWIICGLTTSRMGVLTASFILGGLILNNTYKTNGRVGYKVLILVVLICAIPLGLYLLPSLLNRYSNLYIVQRFINMGLTSTARTRMWNEYIELLKNGKYLIFGAPTSEVYWAAKFYEGNVHNSFLTVHAYLGIVGFWGLIGLILKGLRYSVKSKQWIYFIMLVAFSVRSFSDHVFGCNRISPIILFLLLAAVLPEFGRKDGNKFLGI